MDIKQHNKVEKQITMRINPDRVILNAFFDNPKSDVKGVPFDITLTGKLSFKRRNEIKQGFTNDLGSMYELELDLDSKTLALIADTALDYVEAEHPLPPCKLITGTIPVRPKKSNGSFFNK